MVYILQIVHCHPCTTQATLISSKQSTGLRQMASLLLIVSWFYCPRYRSGSYTHMLDSSPELVGASWEPSIEKNTR